MCSSDLATYKTKDHYFGRTLDYEISYGERVVITPRNFLLDFLKVKDMKTHYAMIGVATVVDGYPLYFDGTNEEGLSMAGLNFPGNADYKEEKKGMDNVTPYEFIPWILGQCANVEEAKNVMVNMNLINTCFNSELPLAPLHWIISDKERSITIESVKEGLKIYDNPVGILTNNPPFESQMFNLNNYMSLSKGNPVNNFAPSLQLDAYSRGMGAIGLPGDLSSMSRFVKAAFTKMNSCSGDSESESISQFFHILGSVEQQRGCVVLGKDKYEVTLYTSCCNTDKGIYYYTTYENNQITGVDMHREDLNSNRLIVYPIVNKQQIRMQN